MKRNFLIIILCVVSAIAGWYGHALVTLGNQSGIQWRFTDAAQRGDIRELERLYAQGAQINAIPTAADGNLSGISALGAAASNGRSEAVEWLLRHGADPNKLDIDMTPLDSALYRLTATQKTIEILQAHGGKRMNEAEKTEPLGAR